MSDDDADGDDPLDPFAVDEGRSGPDPGGEDDSTDRAAAGDSDADAGGDADAPRIENPFPADAGDDGDAARDRGDAPFGDLAEAVGERRRRRRDDGSDPFEEMDVGDVDDEELWASLSGDDGESGGTAAATASAAPAEAVAPASAGGDDRPDHVVDKRQYCQQCPYLSAPPEVACGHDGTEIVEAVDAERFRVRGCPMVTEEGRPNFAAVEEAAAREDATADAATVEADPVADGTVGDAVADDPVDAGGPGTSSGADGTTETPDPGDGHDA